MKTYLIVGESYKQRDFELNKIIHNSLNVIKYDLRVDSLMDVINEANYFSLTNEEKFIVVKCGTLFKATKKDSEDSSSKEMKVLEEYLKHPSDISNIIFVTSEVPDKRRKVYKQIESSGGVIIIPTLNKKDLSYKCIELLKEKGYKINYDTANYIVENSYVNYDIMTNELDKIYTLLKPQEINIDSIKDIISLSVSNNVFGYVNAIIHQDLEGAVKASKNFEVLKIDPTMVLVMIAKEFQILLMLKCGVDGRELQNHLRKEDWQMRAYFDNLDLYKINELKKIIVRLNDYDYKVKSGLLDKSVLLDLITLELCE